MDVSPTSCNYLAKTNLKQLFLKPDLAFVGTTEQVCRRLHRLQEDLYSTRNSGSSASSSDDVLLNWSEEEVVIWGILCGYSTDDYYGIMGLGIRN